MKTNKNSSTGFQMPHVFIILLIIMLFVVVLSYIVPSGSYERLTNEAGISVIDPDTFQYVENENPIRFLNYFEAVYNGFVNGATIMGTLFISSGVIYLLEVSGAFGAGINAILKKTKGKEFSVVCIFLYDFCYLWRFRIWRSRLFHSIRWQSPSDLPSDMTGWSERLWQSSEVQSDLPPVL